MPPRAHGAVPCLAAAMLVVSSGSALAYRPFVSTDAAVADTGEVEIELGYAGFREDAGRATVVAPALVLNLGVMRDVELVGECKLANNLSPEHGEQRTQFEDGEVSLKWVAREGILQERGTGPSIAVELSAVLPTLPGEDRPGGELVGLLSARGLGWTCHADVGALVEPGGTEPGVLWGIIAEHAIRGPLRAVAEVNGESVRRRRADNSILLGAVWSALTPRALHELSFDVGVRRGLSDTAHEWGGTAGVTFAFPWGTTADEEVSR